MGGWLNVGFVQTEDLEALQSALRELLEASGRRLVRPRRRTPAAYDPMQYGHDEEAPRWGLAGFPAAPGWCALRTAPFELLIEPETRLLSRLAERLGTHAFQHNLYDGGGELLVEADAHGAFERSGLGGSHNWERLWGGEEPPMDRLQVRFRLVDPRPAAHLARERWPHLRVSGEIPGTFRAAPGAYDRVMRTPHEQPGWEARRAWLAAVGGETFTEEGPGGSSECWSAHPADVVLAMTGAQGDDFLGGDVRTEAVRLVFGGERAKHCDNGLLVETLVPHAPLPVHPGFVLYADRD